MVSAKRELPFAAGVRSMKKAACDVRRIVLQLFRAIARGFAGLCRELCEA